MGRPYVMDFVISYQAQKNEKNTKLYYIAECLRLIVNNSAMGEERKTIGVSLFEILHPVEENRTADDVINSIREKLVSIGA